MAAVLLDIDGVLHVSGVAIPGAAGGIRRLREDGHRLRFITNNTIRSRARLVGELQAMGFDLGAEEIETAQGSSSTRELSWLRSSTRHPSRPR